MSEIIRFSNEFLPHVVKLFHPDLPAADARLDYFRRMFALYQPAPEQSCLLIKGKDRLQACAYLAAMEPIQPGLVYVNLALDKYLTDEDWQPFWAQCIELAKTIVSAPPLIRIALAGSEIPELIKSSGFALVREQNELHAPLGQLPPVQADEFGDFKVVSLAELPELEHQWLEIFNQGLSVFWDMPPLNGDSLQRWRKINGYDPSAFRLGIDSNEPVTALFYSVLDTSQGIVRINAAATPSVKRSKGYGRRMLKDALNHLEGLGYKTAITYTDASNQATNLLFKMLGLRPAGTVKILESQGSSLRRTTPGGESSSN